ncbi:hypothetical protein [Actinomadura hibisca]|uniref:hypothetical protein n=1 Tax=Actinomadura hibisca TaxID=68565 RepID=UPI000829FDDC|nr:hypothetical protein [Actinomadura hibisca]
MVPERTFGGLFNRGGRLRRRWAAAIAEPDPAQAVARLREVLAEIAEHPDAYARQWAEVQGSLLEDRLLPLLADEDFRTLETLGAQTGAPLPWPLVAARAARGEDTEARALAGRVTDPPPSESVPLLARLLATGFDSGTVRIAEASTLARRFPDVPGAERTLGLHALLVDGDAAEAASHFSRAPEDETTFVGLLAARLRLGDHDGVTAPAARRTVPSATRADHPAAPSTAHPNHPANPSAHAEHRADPSATRTDHRAAPLVRASTELATLSALLAWLDDPAATGPAPADTARLTRFTIAAHAGEWLDYAIGRMYLLEGDAQRAAQLLPPLAEAFPGRPDWDYHAAWALLLRDDPEAVAQRYARSPTWPLGCLLQDADPARKFAKNVKEAPPPAAYAELAAARASLARGEHPPAEAQNWQHPTGTLADHLEALRTVLGLRFARHNQWALAQAMEIPLFRRLPAAERLRWSGLAALRTHPDRGRALLTEAADALGYGRAALALATHEAQEGHFDAALRLLDGPARPSGPKADLLRTWLQTRADPDAENVPAAQALPQARYALGHLRLRQAARRQADGDAEQAMQLALTAATAFDEAAADAPRTIPRDARALARAAELFAGRAPGGLPDDTAAKLRRAAADHPWATWVLGLAELTGPTIPDPGLCDRLVHLLDGAADAPPQAVTALAGALTGAYLRADGDARAAPLPRLLAGLTERHGLPEVHRLNGIVRAAALRRPGSGAGPAGPADLPVALAAARRELAAGDGDAALRLLRAAPVQDATGRHIRDLLAAALSGDPGEFDPPEGVPGRLTAALLAAQAAALAESAPDECRALLVRTLPEHDVSGLVDLHRVLPALCAAPGRGGGARPRELAAVLRKVAADGGFDPLTLARCATAANDHETAERAWREALRAGTDEETVREEYGRYLCHRATTARRRNEPLEAARLLRRAAGILDGQEPDQFLPEEDEVAEVRRVYQDRLRGLNQTRRTILAAEWDRAAKRYAAAAAAGLVAKALGHFEEMRALANTGSLRGRWEG